MAHESNYRHIYLYAKGHYAQGNEILDLRVILAKRSNMQPNQIGRRDIFQVVLNAVMESIAAGCHEYRYDIMMRNLLEDIWSRGDRLFSSGRPEDISDAVIKSMLSTLMMCRVFSHDGVRLIELGEPDPEILPLKHHPKVEMPV